MRSAEQFKEAILDVLEEERWTVPTLLETYNANHMTREGARVYALEHCVFAANFPRWLTSIAGAAILFPTEGDEILKSKSTFDPRTSARQQILSCNGLN